jgi:hypothetical protein
MEGDGYKQTQYMLHLNSDKWAMGSGMENMSNILLDKQRNNFTQKRRRNQCAEKEQIHRERIILPLYKPTLIKTIRFQKENEFTIKENSKLRINFHSKVNLLSVIFNCKSKEKIKHLIINRFSSNAEYDILIKLLTKDASYITRMEICSFSIISIDSCAEQMFNLFSNFKIDSKFAILENKFCCGKTLILLDCKKISEKILLNHRSLETQEYIILSLNNKYLIQQKMNERLSLQRVFSFSLIPKNDNIFIQTTNLHQNTPIDEKCKLEIIQGFFQCNVEKVDNFCVIELLNDEQELIKFNTKNLFGIIKKEGENNQLLCNQNQSHIESLCIICCQNRRDSILLDCGHAVYCLSCADLIVEELRCRPCKKNSNNAHLTQNQLVTIKRGNILCPLCKILNKKYMKIYY